MKILLLIAIVVLAVLWVSYLALHNKKLTDDSDRLVFRDAQGRELTRADLTGLSGTVKWEIVGSDNVSQRAQELLSLGRQAGAEGDYQRALDLFAQAHKEAPGWPYPIYEAAYTYLLNGDPARAEREYEAVERLAPRGFFTYQSELDCLRRERKGEFAAGTCRAYVYIADAPNSAEKREALEKLLERSPCFAPAWQKLASVLEDDNDANLAAIDKGLACNPDPQTRGYLLINKALNIRLRGKYDEAIGMLGNLAVDPQSPLDTQLLAKQSLSFILAEPNAHRKAGGSPPVP